MAIKRLRLNDEGEHEERQLEKSELPPPPPKPAKRAPRKRSTTSKAASAVKTTRLKDAPQRKVPAGRTVLDEGVLRYTCAKCGSSRVFKDAPEEAPTCGMCDKVMRRD